MRKCISIFVLSIFLTIFFQIADSSASVAQAANIKIQEGSVWYIKEHNVFGASVSINNAEYEHISYLLVNAEDNVNNLNIYQKKFETDWTFIGVRTSRGEYRRFPSALSQEIFIKVSDSAANIYGLKKMF